MKLNGLKMQLSEIKSPLIVIIGPTAVGKTEISLRLAERLDGEIVSADSRLFYRGMDIGTAKPSKEEMNRVPHHLIDVANPNEVWSLALFQQAAKEAIEDIQERGRLPLLVGGTGQYIRSVIEGWEPPEQQPDDSMRSVLQDWADTVGPRTLYDKLMILDPKACEKIDVNNVRRTIRALEVIFKTGKRFSEQRRKGNREYDLLIIGLNRPRQEVYERVDLRIEKMIDAGWVEEVAKLIENGYDPELTTLSAIGYREIAAYLAGEMSLKDAIIQIKSITHQFVRRQANWFKPDDDNIHWFDIHTDVENEIWEFIQSGKGWLRKT
jgi:tRNA dimethylallyltransferase